MGSCARSRAWIWRNPGWDASTSRDSVTLATHRAQLRAIVGGGDASDGARTRAGDGRFGGGGPGAGIAHALQHVAVGDPGGGEEDVLAGYQVVAVEYPI